MGDDGDIARQQRIADIVARISPADRATFFAGLDQLGASLTGRASGSPGRLRRPLRVLQPARDHRGPGAPEHAEMCDWFETYGGVESARSFDPTHIDLELWGDSAWKTTGAERRRYKEARDAEAE